MCSGVCTFYRAIQELTMNMRYETRHLKLAALENNAPTRTSGISQAQAVTMTEIDSSPDYSDIVLAVATPSSSIIAEFSADDRLH
jgi:hypothetical protein